MVVNARNTGTGRRGFLRRTVSAQIHGAGALAAVGGLILLGVTSLNAADPKYFWSSLVFGLTGTAVLGISSLYHFLSDGYGISNKLEVRFERADHIAIFLFIAGTYTPILLVAVNSEWSLILLELVWLVAVLGILVTLFRERLPRFLRHRYAQTGLFVLMGWLLLIRVSDIVSHLNLHEKYFLFAGAAAYSLVS